MRKLFYIATLLSCSFTFNQNFSLLAAQSVVTSPNLPSNAKETGSKKTHSSSSTSTHSTEIKKGGAQGTTQSSNSGSASDVKSSNAKTEGKSGVANQKENGTNRDQMPEWMLESAQIAKEYVIGLDNEQYSQSWTKADELFQNTITQDEWIKALNLSRKGLGKMKSRVLKIQRPAWNPQGLPAGPYMVVEFETSFENSPDSGELLTLRRGNDGKWRVLTYQVN